jgi:acetyl-CoA carboxylase carboxyl transferase subunit beta
MGIFQKRAFDSEKQKKKEMPEGLWQKCPECGEVTHSLVLAENENVCPKCEYHFTQGAHARLQHLLDPGSFVEHDAKMTSVDTLKFKGMATYTDRLKSYQKKTGLKDAVISGLGSIEGRKVSIAVMDFAFLAATMGSVVGEKITRAIERGTEQRLPVLVISASGGARMYEGMLSLMQMAKTSGALALHAQARLPYISILTNPTTAGVMASFASLGDLILAEPKCMIGFAGPRVIRETTHQELPPGFQTAEFLEEHGLVDAIVHRKKMRGFLTETLKYLAPAE